MRTTCRVLPNKSPNLPQDRRRLIHKRRIWPLGAKQPGAATSSGNRAAGGGMASLRQKPKVEERNLAKEVWVPKTRRGRLDAQVQNENDTSKLPRGGGFGYFQKHCSGHPGMQGGLAGLQPSPSPPIGYWRALTCLRVGWSPAAGGVAGVGVLPEPLLRQL